MTDLKYKFDVLIIGSGISGLSTAVKCAENGLDVCVLSKEENLEECNTYYAQGGIIGSSPDDSSELLSSDIIRAGCGINSMEAVKILTAAGPAEVTRYLAEKIKVPFFKVDGILDYTKEAAHSVRRILHVKDHTGKEIETSFLEYATRNKKIKFFRDHIAVDIITNSHHSEDSQECYKDCRAIGAYVLDRKKGKVIPFFAPAIVLAAGGIGNLFLHTSNPASATGDGIAIAYRTGAAIIKSEYVQFHPTVLYHRDVKRFLITEALRGEGARLVNRKGEYFMERYNPVLKDLAPRDEVARAIYNEMEEDGYVLLDATGIKNLSLKDRFPMIYEKCISVGIDIENDPIPVVPAAHYFCGGIKVSLHGQTSVPGLYAVGETACTGVHGANRLASVSLLEGLFFGLQTGKHIVEKADVLTNQLTDTIPEWVYPADEKNFDPVLINHDLRNIQITMWNYSGIVRTKNRLLRAISDINYLSHRIERFYRKATITKGIIELRNAVLTASLIAKAAYSNSESIGCHYMANVSD